MILFDNVEYENFFNPLCCKNRRIYYECMVQLIEKSKAVSLLYETDARDTLTLYLRNCAYVVEEEENSGKGEERISSKKSETENASAILRYFRQCGWISERHLGRNGDNIASVMPYCLRMIDSIERIFNRDNSVALSNHIFSIYDTLRSVFMTEHIRTHRPYSNILIPVVDSVSHLKNEFSILRDSIQSIMCVIIKMTETNELGQFLIKDEVMKSFFSDYFFLKKDGLIPGYIEEIEKMLKQLTQMDIYAKMIGEYQNLKQVDEIKAKEEVDSCLDGVRNFIGYDYVREMDYIDKKINNYYRLYLTRMTLVISNNVNVQTHLNNLLIRIKDYDTDTKREVLEVVSKCFTLREHKYVGRKSIERKKKRKPNMKSGAIITSRLSDEDKARLTKELLYEFPDRYGINQATTYFDKLLNGKSSATLDQIRIKTRDDAMMIAASMIYSGAEEFLYEVEFLEGVIKTEVATISNVKIKRRI